MLSLVFNTSESINFKLNSDNQNPHEAVLTGEGEFVFEISSES
ncbi:MAG: hypothetical protein JWN60_849 [Acidobacteria bacterium]|nr:hypothetical protein [Acidobacteriota bacterium]